MGDLLVGESLHVAEKERLTERKRKRGCGTQDRACRLPDRLVEGLLTYVARLAAAGEARAHGGPPGAVDTSVSRKREKPGREGGVAPKAPKAAPSGEEDLLREFLGIARIDGRCEAERQDRLPVALDEEGERPLVAEAGTLDRRILEAPAAARPFLELPTPTHVVECRQIKSAASLRSFHRIV